VRIGERQAAGPGALLTDEPLGSGALAPSPRPASSVPAQGESRLTYVPAQSEPPVAYCPADLAGTAFRAAVGNRISGLVAGSGPFDEAYGHMLAAPGKRLRAAMVVGAAGLRPHSTAAPVTPGDILNLGCVVEMFHEASLVHDDICDGSMERRGSASMAAKFGTRFAARLGFHLAGAALRTAADVFDRNPWVLRRLAHPDEQVLFHRLGDLSFGQIVERLPPQTDPDRLRRHYRRVAAAKTGTLFQLACSYGVALADGDQEQMRAALDYAEGLAFAFQVMDDVRDIEGAPSLGKKAGTDLERAIPTWPLIEWLDLAPGSAEFWRAAVAGELSAAQLEALGTDVVGSGATDRAHAIATAESRTACARLLDAFPDDTAGRRFLLELGQRVVTR
jgi:geranylgeranyl pyrophosphate synthase